MNLQQLAIYIAAIVTVYLCILWPLSISAQAMPTPCLVSAGGEVQCNHVWLPVAVR